MTPSVRLMSESDWARWASKARARLREFSIAACSALSRSISTWNARLIQMSAIMARPSSVELCAIARSHRRKGRWAVPGCCVMTDDLPFARRAPYARLAIGWFPLGYFCAVWLRRGYQGFGEGANAMKTGKEELSIRVG